MIGLVVAVVLAGAQQLNTSPQILPPPIVSDGAQPNPDVPAGADSDEDFSNEPLENLRAGLGKKPWLADYFLAMRLFRNGTRDEAVKWFYVGQLRGRVNARCVDQDPSGGPALLASLNSMMGEPINEYAGGNPDTWMRSIENALAWDAANPDPHSPGARCDAARNKQRQGLAELRRWIADHRAEIQSERTKNGFPND